jgi:4-carboxymuconolactone decarboxylase
MTHPRGRAGLAERLASITAGEASDDPAPGSVEESGLDARTHALVRLAALVAAGAPGPDYDRYVCTALDQGVTPDEVVGLLVALLPTVGTSRVSAAAHAVHAILGRATPGLPDGAAGQVAP